MSSRPGGKGFILEELLKAYFSRAGYFVVRGVPYRMDGEDISDIDLWLYERPGAATRRRIIVDIKNKRSPKASERIIWTKGLQSAVGVDTAIVATTTRSESAKRLAKGLGIVLLDGDAISRLTQSDQLRDEIHLSLEELDDIIRAVDKARRSSEWRMAFQDSRASLINGFGIQSANKNIGISAYFSEQALMAQENSMTARAAIRMVYFSASLVSLSLDFFMADHTFRSPDDKRKILLDGLRFGQSDAIPVVSTINTAIGLVRQYAQNGNAIARQIELGFFADANRIPAEIIADHISKISGRADLFNISRELESAAFSAAMPSFDQLGANTKSFLGVLFDFGGISRESIAVISKEDKDKAQLPLISPRVPLANRDLLFPNHKEDENPKKNES